MFAFEIDGPNPPPIIVKKKEKKIGRFPFTHKLKYFIDCKLD